jgi:anti-anti-sigma factor
MLAGDALPFQIRRARDPDGVARLEFSGELDLSVAGQVGDYVKRLTSDEPAARIDLSKLEFLDLPALRALIRAIEEGREHGCVSLVIPEMGHAVAHLVQVAGIAERLWPGNGRSEQLRGPTR